MTIADREEVGPAVFTQVRHDQVRVLVHFVWVLWAIARLGGEGKLCHAVVKLLCLGTLGRLNYWFGGCHLS